VGDRLGLQNLPKTREVDRAAIFMLLVLALVSVADRLSCVIAQSPSERKITPQTVARWANGEWVKHA